MRTVKSDKTYMDCARGLIPSSAQQKEGGFSLLAIVVCLGIIGVLIPILGRFVDQSVRMSASQGIEGDYENLRYLLRNQFDCADTKAAMYNGGLTNLAKCQTGNGQVFQIKAMDRSNAEIFDNGTPTAAKNWLGTYQMRLSCDSTSKQMYFQALKTKSVGGAPASNPMTSSQMTWTTLFKIPICDW
ncbi:MAG: type II secretion system protein [Proteobacteria bacterium]|nr:type II secretion system protein [Pseudomonadota bacterium]